jgi:multicomponent K+:H+ antiporter subunit C
MELMVSSAVGLLMAVGIYLTLRRRSFPVILGLTLITYSVNVFLLAMGRLATHQPPVITKGVTDYADPLPQALVLTAIVISFGMTALTVVMALRAYLENDTDRVDLA